MTLQSGADKWLDSMKRKNKEERKSVLHNDIKLATSDKKRRKRDSRSVQLLRVKTELKHPSFISPVCTTSSMLFSLSSWVHPASGGLDHTFHTRQLSDGELHLLSEAGWARRRSRRRCHRPASAGAHNYCLKDDYAVYSCPYAQQMTVSHSQLPLPRLSVKAFHLVMRK